MRAVSELPDPMANRQELAGRLDGRRAAVFCDYDGTLTPIVERPQDARISPGMREAVGRLAARCPVCVVSGRDRRVVQELMGIDDLVVAGSHGFDIWSPRGGTVRREEGAGSRDLLRAVEARLRERLAGVGGILLEPKSVSLAVHYRMVAEAERPSVEAAVDEVLARHPDELKVTPGKLVYEIQPRIDWDKGRAVQYLLHALALDTDDVVPLYLGDDVTDEDAFRALAGRGIGIFVGSADDPEVAGRTTCADYALADVDEVQRFIDELAGWIGAGGIVRVRRSWPR
jgi:trehalose 6-phosphate phosphatase